MYTSVTSFPLALFKPCVQRERQTEKKRNDRLAFFFISLFFMWKETLPRVRHFSVNKRVQHSISMFFSHRTFPLRIRPNNSFDHRTSILLNKSTTSQQSSRHAKSSTKSTEYLTSSFSFSIQLYLKNTLDGKRMT